MRPLASDLKIPYDDVQKTTFAEFVSVSPRDLFPISCDLFFMHIDKNSFQGINSTALFVPTKQIQCSWFLHRCLQVNNYSIMCCTRSKLFYIKGYAYSHLRSHCLTTRPCHGGCRTYNPRQIPKVSDFHQFSKRSAGFSFRKGTKMSLFNELLKLLCLAHKQNLKSQSIGSPVKVP